ncbi:MAG: NADH-quinone oxidoreductase subunit NuoN [Alphaproteobacteria bacterium]|nr:NADH-quinone oxidoreductase subunit NuoN [Alphaproteobacteria bacterium]
MNDSLSLSALTPLLPEIFLAVAGLALLVVGVVREQRHGLCAMCRAVAFCFVLACVFMLGLDWHRTVALNGMFVMDQFAGVMKFMILGGLLISVVLGEKYLAQEGLARFEYPLLILFAGLGMMVMVSANHMLVAYMGLELQSLSLYVLAAFRRGHGKSSEAGIKYFLLGALASGFLLFGMSLIYGYTGALSFDGISHVLRASGEGALALPALVGMVFIIIGIAFKISAVPFHMWTPDVYEGAAGSVTALFAIVPKVAAMGLLLRILFAVFEPAQDQWQQIMWLLSMGSMLVGAFGALAQTNIKRLMAYSSINHMGYALIGVVAASQTGVAGVIFYMMVYMLMAAGVFAVVLMMRRGGIALRETTDLAGLGLRNPAIAYAMAILMFSMAGIPPMAGFFCKMFVFQAAIAEGFYVLSVVGVLTTAVAAFYYLRIIKIMFFDKPAEALDQDFGFGRRAVLLGSVLFVVLFILNPDVLIEISRSAAAAVMVAP